MLGQCKRYKRIKRGLFMRTSLFVLIMMFVFIAQPAKAELCYTPVEAEAEQGIRIHSELMVIALNCQHMGARNGDNLYAQYQNFTNDQSILFSAYERVLLEFFTERGDKAPEASLHTLRTDFANKISSQAAGLRPDVFCSRFSPRIEMAGKMNQEEIRHWAAKIYPTHPVKYPVCAG
jgi:hypothetical protein